MILKCSGRTVTVDELMEVIAQVMIDYFHEDTQSIVDALANAGADLASGEYENLIDGKFINIRADEAEEIVDYIRHYAEEACPKIYDLWRSIDGDFRTRLMIQEDELNDTAVHS